MQVAARLPTTAHRAANSRPTPELSPEAQPRSRQPAEQRNRRGLAMPTGPRPHGNALHPINATDATR